MRTAGDAALWVTTKTFWLAAGDGVERRFVAERVRAYRDRLVLKLEGVEGATAAAAMRGATVSAAFEDAPRLPEGVHYTARLAGLEVVDESGRSLGTVADVQATAGADLLRVRPPAAAAGDDDALLLIPMARSIVLDIDERRGRIAVRLPPGLEELNR